MVKPNNKESSKGPLRKKKGVFITLIYVDEVRVWLIPQGSNKFIPCEHTWLISNVEIVLGWLCETHVEENRSIALWLQRWRHLSARVYSGRIDAINNQIKSNLLIKRKGLCNQFSCITYNLSLTIYNKMARRSHRPQNAMILIGHIATSRQREVTCDRDRDFHVTSDVRRKLHHTDDVKSEILICHPLFASADTGIYPHAASQFGRAWNCDAPCG